MPLLFPHQKKKKKKKRKKRKLAKEPIHQISWVQQINTTRIESFSNFSCSSYEGANTPRSSHLMFDVKFLKLTLTLT